MIVLRMGIGSGVEATLEEVGEQLKVTRERVRQMEMKVLRQLRHPLLLNPLRHHLGYAPQPLPLLDVQTHSEREQLVRRYWLDQERKERIDQERKEQWDRDVALRREEWDRVQARREAQELDRDQQLTVSDTLTLLATDKRSVDEPDEEAASRVLCDMARRQVPTLTKITTTITIDRTRTLGAILYTMTIWFPKDAKGPPTWRSK